MSCSVSHVSKPSAIKLSRYSLSPSRVRIGAKGVIEAVGSESGGIPKIDSDSPVSPYRLLRLPL